MPGFDGTGPNGIGPMTGRGMGFCTGLPRVGSFGGRGRGRGYRRMYYATGIPGYARYDNAYPVYPAYNEPTEADEINYLKNQKNYMEKELEQIKERLNELEDNK